MEKVKSPTPETRPNDRSIGQLFFIGIPGPQLDKQTQDLLAEVVPGGICLFARNIKSLTQTRELLDSIIEFLPTRPFLSIDQEGGTVDRLRRIMTPAPAASKFSDAADVRSFAEITAESLRILGFNMNFAPVVDVITPARENPGNGLYSRGFGSSPEEVAELAGSFLRTLQCNGVIGCIKHFPGLGAAIADSHDLLPKIDSDDDEIRATDLYPFAKLVGGEAQMVMVAHAAYPNSHLQQKDQNGRLLPSSLSFNFVSKLLRNDLNFEGIVITDDLEMGSIVRNYGIDDACKMALRAGNDMLAICSDSDAIESGFSSVSLGAADGEIEKERIESSVNRILDLKSRLVTPLDFDADRLSELSEQLANLTSRLS